MNILVSIDCLHCLSAFTAFPAVIGQSNNAGREHGSSLPFGVHCFPRSQVVALNPTNCLRSSLPFGVHCFPRKQRPCA